ncbi:fatty acyl-AMP ligase [Streptomyces sp. E11-3]|uniref:fatty acyl-AMP ligase n=1 Tax=Streptomyces sp. E11-3 TaxID=3110112 RepID=UPI0039814847
MSTLATFTDLVHDRAAELTDTVAHVFLRDTDGGTAPEQLTYAELDLQARTIASRLQEYGAKGQPVLLLYPPGPDFLTAFIGCLYAGAIAVPAPLPGGRGQQLQRVTGIIKDTDARLVLSDTANAPDVSLWLAMAGIEDTVCLATDTSGCGDPDDWRRPRTGPDDLALLQYTSGSTSDPRGVMVSQGNLMANMAVIGRGMATTSDDRFGGWLPHFHDMGLIAHLLHPLWLGSSSVQMAPTSFLKRPIRWLQAVGEYGVTVGGGPNFCYDLCLRRISDAQAAELDLSSWRLALNGAEPVRAATLEAFAQKFAPAGLRLETQFPCYGLAEATLMVSGGPAGQRHTERVVDAKELEQGTVRASRPGHPGRTVVSSGLADGFDVRIVDSVRGAELPPDAVGEIWLKSDSVAQGYWGCPEESAETFHATLEARDTAERLTGYLRTGDLGTVADGQLYITGRLKETIILNGRNLAPQDIEWAVRELGPEFAQGTSAAFTVETGSERLVIVQEVRTGATEWEEMRHIAHEIQALIGRDFNIPAGNVLLVRPGTVRRTTSGKIQRSRMRKLFLEGEITGQYEVLEPSVRALVRADELQRLGDW